MLKEKVELIAPSGDWSSLHSAVAAGADSVYFGVKEMNMRYAAANFDILEIKKVMQFLHKNKKKGYLALNVIIYEKELAKIKKILNAAKDAKVDSVILWDMAVLSMAKKLGLKIDLSTQASVSNFSALKYYNSLGVKRIVLARESTLSDIKEIISKIKKEKLNCSIETFIHGAMCVSISGRCFLSHQAFSKSANRGECLQPCRREYDIIDKDKECEYVIGSDYIMSAKDLCTISFIDELIKAGISSFKIEGRIRSSEYVKVVTSCYRRAIDAFYEGKLTQELKEKLLKELKGAYNRGFTDGFYFGRPNDTGGKIEKEYDKLYVGEIIKFFKKINVAEIAIKDKPLKIGDKILITGKRTPADFIKVTEMEIGHEPIKSAKRGEKIGLKLPFRAYPKDKVFIWKKH